MGEIFAAAALHAPAARAASSATVPIVCISHLRWDFVYQRPQHLMTRFAAKHPVLYVEEPVRGNGPSRLEVRDVAPNVTVAVPVLGDGPVTDAGNRAHHETHSDEQQVASLLAAFLRHWTPTADCAPIVWYYTPLGLKISGGVESQLVVYDCMDQLRNFLNAPPDLLMLEGRLLVEADLVFTGGLSLHEDKSRHHPDVHAFPSSVDVEHFVKARARCDEPADMVGIPHPRIGFYGVIDERFDIELLAGAAALRPDWHWVVLGPVVKIDPASLPTGSNIHYLAGRSYDELPSALAHWDVAMMPFAHNAATRYISPTKTPEYLASGKPVVSTSIVDVVRTYGSSGLVRFADGPEAFVAAVDKALQDAVDPTFVERADAFLAGMSWDRTQASMSQLIDAVIERKAQESTNVQLASAA